MHAKVHAVFLGIKTCTVVHGNNHTFYDTAHDDKFHIIDEFALG